MEITRKFEQAYRKPALPQIQSGDTVRVHQLIREGNKQRTQVFEGVVIRRHRMGEVSACITVRRIASGIGVEKTFLLHSPNVSKVEVMRRAKVRRSFLSYLRDRRGKSARLKEVAFDKAAANDVTPKAVASDDRLDAELTEIDAAQSGDALDDAVSTNGIENAENRQVAGEDDVTSNQNLDTSDEANAPSEEANIGLDKADGGEGKAVKS